jgi:hypothetical protein
MLQCEGQQLINLRTPYSKLPCVAVADADGASCRCGVVDGAQVPGT